MNIKIIYMIGLCGNLEGSVHREIWDRIGWYFRVGVRRRKLFVWD